MLSHGVEAHVTMPAAGRRRSVADASSSGRASDPSRVVQSRRARFAGAGPRSSASRTSCRPGARHLAPSSWPAGSWARWWARGSSSRAAAARPCGAQTVRVHQRAGAASTRRRSPLERMLIDKDLGEMPPADRPSERALWVAALLNPCGADRQAWPVLPRYRACTIVCRS